MLYNVNGSDQKENGGFNSDESSEIVLDNDALGGINDDELKVNREYNQYKRKKIY